MLIFCIDFQGPLRTMIEMYDRYLKINTVSYLGCDVKISFIVAEFTRVLDIPRKRHKIALKVKKMNLEAKDFYI